MGREGELGKLPSHPDILKPTISTKGKCLGENPGQIKVNPGFEN
jgi:hypothetical protein